jgi:transcriptional regulator GlxA family with amidase domain
MTPALYIVQLRLEAARGMLEDSGRSVDHVARECGFGTPETLRRVFLRELKIVPREYRRRFHAVPETLSDTSHSNRRFH